RRVIPETGEVLPSVVAVDVQRRLLVLGAGLRGHQDDALGAAEAVDGRGRVLENADALDVVRIEVVQWIEVVVAVSRSAHVTRRLDVVLWNSVDDNQRAAEVADRDHVARAGTSITGVCRSDAG